MLRLLLFFYCLCLPLSIFAKIDPEIVESLKCMQLFNQFEYKYNIPLDTLHSIALKESGRPHSKHKIDIVWPWTVNIEGKGYYFNEKTEAVNFIKRKFLSGKRNIDVGCMQINLKHHPYAFSSVEDALEPINNVSYAAIFLKEKYQQFGSWHKAIANYHSATEELGTKYKKAVIKIAKNMQNYQNSFNLYANFDYTDNNAYYDNKSLIKKRTISTKSLKRKRQGKIMAYSS